VAMQTATQTARVRFLFMSLLILETRRGMSAGTRSRRSTIAGKFAACEPRLLQERLHGWKFEVGGSEEPNRNLIRFQKI